MTERQPDGSLYVLPEPPAAHELVERLAGGDGVVIERIVSAGQGTPVGEWLEQDRDEDPPCIWLAVHAAGLATTGGIP